MKGVEQHNYGNTFPKSLHDAIKSKEKANKNKIMLRQRTLRMNSQNEKRRRSCLENHERR